MTRILLALALSACGCGPLCAQEVAARLAQIEANNQARDQAVKSMQAQLVSLEMKLDALAARQDVVLSYVKGQAPVPPAAVAAVTTQPAMMSRGMAMSMGAGCANGACGTGGRMRMRMVSR